MFGNDNETFRQRTFNRYFVTVQSKHTVYFLDQL